MSDGILKKDDILGKYRIEKEIGRGAVGIVYKAHDPSIDRMVAIKTLLPTLLQSDKKGELSLRFQQEAKAAARCAHSNILTIYEFAEDKEIPFIAMEYVQGEELKKFLKDFIRFKIQDVVVIAQQILAGLKFAHSKQVIHRDIKPANIIFNQTLNKATLTDFGIAYIADHSKTKTGTIMGSPYYMSPEQVIGKKVDGRSDIFSLGVTMYQLLSGELPFRGESIASVAFHITNTKHESVRNHLSKLPSSTARITNKALQKDVSKRYQSMKEFRQALVNALKKDYKKQPL